MSDPVQLLQHVASQLKLEGKSPSLALFRARLAGRLSAQQLFTAYQHWRNNPQYAALPTVETEQQSAPIIPVAQPDDIQQQLNRIEAKLDLLLGKMVKD